MTPKEPPPYLTDNEIAGICEPLTMPSAQVRFMKKKLGLLVETKPNRRPLVARSEFERVLGAGRFDTSEPARQGPNIASIRERWANRKDHGTQTQER